MPTASASPAHRVSPYHLTPEARTAIAAVAQRHRAKLAALRRQREVEAMLASARGGR